MAKQPSELSWRTLGVGALLGVVFAGTGMYAGTKIAFASNRDGNYEVYVMNADGSGQTRLTSNTATDLEPTWSPDGTKIVFESFRDGNYEIYVMDADGTDQVRRTNEAAPDRHVAPFFSPAASEPQLCNDYRRLAAPPSR